MPNYHSPTPRLNHSTFGSSLKTRSYSAGSGFRFGFNGKENFDQYQDYGFRIYYPELGKFLSVDPLFKIYPYYSLFHFAGNRPLDCIDIDGSEPLSVIKRSTHEKIINIPDDLPSKRERLVISVIDYSYTNTAAHLLSLVSGISEKEIQKVKIKNYGLLLPLYSTEKGGGAMTLPTGSSESYSMLFTDNFFDQTKIGKYKTNDFSNDVINWLNLSSHEVGHIKDIIELGNNRANYLTTFTAGYIKNLCHDKYWREKRAEKGRAKFSEFNKYVNENYGKRKLEILFNNSELSEKSKIEQIDKWWGDFSNKKK